jgi:hypothetical protein
MNIQRWKGIVWLLSLAVGGFLVFQVAGFLRNREGLAKEVTSEELAAVLDAVKKPEEQKSDVIDYTAIQKVFHDHDWTGKEKPKPVVPVETGPVEKPKKAIASLLKVLAIKVDTGKPERSAAYVKFVDLELANQAQEREDTILRPEERLFAPYDDVRVESISAAGVVFAFDDDTRERETVTTSPYTSSSGQLGIVVVGPDGAIGPELQRQIQLAGPDVPPWRPEQLTALGKNRYQVGTDTLRQLDEDYSRILSRDLSYSTYKNPRTGATEGIKINSVKPGSIPAQAGLSEGEVLKSINGHRVTSVNDAIAYVKANADATDTWVALFEKQGREFTRTYHSPSD